MTRPDEPVPPVPDPLRAALVALGPDPMPDDVAARIRARLTAEAGPAVDPGARPAVGPVDARAVVTGTGITDTGGTGTGTGTGGSARPGARGDVRRAAPPSRPGRAPAGGTRSRRARLVRAGLGLAAAAAAAGLVAVPVLAGPGDRHPAPVGSDAPPDDELRAAAGAAGPPGGPLADPGHRRGCLTAAGVADPGAPLVAAGPHPVGGRPGELLVLGTPERGVFRLVVVDAGCRPGRGELLAEVPAVR